MSGENLDAEAEKDRGDTWCNVLCTPTIYVFYVSRHLVKTINHTICIVQNLCFYADGDTGMSTGKNMEKYGKEYSLWVRRGEIRFISKRNSALSNI